MLGFGLYFYFRVQGFDEDYDGGRVWGAWLVSLAVASANIGAANTIGSVTLAYTEGPSAFWYVTLQALAFIPFAYLAVPKIYPLQETTLAEFLEHRYRPWLRPVSAGALGLATMAILPAQIVGGASVIVSLIGIDYTTAFFSVGAALILYTALGGLPSVTYNDTYQWAVIVLGFAVGVPLIVSNGGGIERMLGSLPESHRSWWFGGSGGWSVFTIAAWSITVLIARFGSQEWYQRTRAARSADAARRGFIAGGLMAAPFGVLTMLIGVAALELYPNLANPNEAFSRTMMEAIPTGFRALMMSAVLAAVVSSGESSVNAATALVVNDLLKPVLAARALGPLLPPPVAGWLRRPRRVGADAGGGVARDHRVHPPRVPHPDPGGDHRHRRLVLARRHRHRRRRRHRRRHLRRAGVADVRRCACRRSVLDCHAGDAGGAGDRVAVRPPRAGAAPGVAS